MRGLIFGTYCCTSPERAGQIRHWAHFHHARNPECDLMLVGYDDEYRRIDDLNEFSWLHVVRDRTNIGHLARSGRDGWGRDFCGGLHYAIHHEYDYVAAIESDSLFRLPVMPIFRQMREEQIQVASVPVRGTKRFEIDWVETGLMMFNVDYVRRHQVIQRYDWENPEPKRKYPELPERHMHRIVAGQLRYMPWHAERGDIGQINENNVDRYDWITHVPWQVANAFSEDVLHHAQ